jgi:hypothetical protein
MAVVLGEISVTDLQIAPKSAVTQLSSATTAVSVTQASGVITTVSLTTAAQASATFTVNCPFVINKPPSALSSAGSQVILTIQSYSGTYSTNGIPVVAAGAVSGPNSAGFTITISNAHGTNALSGTLSIGYTVV